MNKHSIQELPLKEFSKPITEKLNYTESKFRNIQKVDHETMLCGQSLKEQELLSESLCTSFFSFKHLKVDQELYPYDYGLLSLLPGEKTVSVNNVTYLCPFTNPVQGVLYITNYKLHFQSVVREINDSVITINLPLGFLSKVEKISRAKNKEENSYGFELFCKDCRNLRFALKPKPHMRRGIFEKLQIYAFPRSNNLNLFAFQYLKKYSIDGWNIYQPEDEYKRLGLPNNYWKISKINEQYELCVTYPSIIAVSSSANHELLRSVANFRSKGRLPVLSWIHPDNNATITRCSQPLVGMSSKSCKEDEQYIQMIQETNIHSKKIFIMDARPIVNAAANKARGGGYENDAYQNTELIFLGIHNIHVMRESFKKIKEICFSSHDENHWFTLIDSTQLLKHIELILCGVHHIVDKLENNFSVLVHCSDGWDRTAQLTSLAMLILDPYYRTLKGFEVLIEKEWISFGHKFSQRVGHRDDKHSDAERSPIFLQFIDAVWQLTCKYPRAFEFNETFLLEILDHLFSCLFGTFFFNSECQRMKENIKTSTASLWSYINSNLNYFINPFYVPKEQIIFSMPYSQFVQLWKNYYCRWNPGMKLQNAVLFRSQELLILKAQLEKLCEIQISDFQ